MGAATVDGDFLDGLARSGVQAGSFGGTFAVVLVFARWLLTWLTGRHDRREAILDEKDTALDERWAKYTKKIEERYEAIDERCHRMEAEVEDCHRSKRDLERRLALLEGFDQGMGERRQEDQRAASLKNMLGDKT